MTKIYITDVNSNITVEALTFIKAHNRTRVFPVHY